MFSKVKGHISADRKAIYYKGKRVAKLEDVILLKGRLLQ